MSSSSNMFESSCPRLSELREEFSDYKILMVAYLNALELWPVVENDPSTLSSSSSKNEKSTVSERSNKAYFLLLKSLTANQRRSVSGSSTIIGGNAWSLWNEINRLF
jgi:hypothetical protein